MALKLSNIKSLFIVEDETPENKTSENTGNTKLSDKKSDKNAETENTSESKISWKTSSSSNIQNTNETTVTASSGAFNQKIFDSLTKAIFDNNLPGEDYLEFMEALKAMKDLPLDDNIKMKTVLATLSTKGLTVAKIIESADYYLKILENEKSKFYTALDGQKHGNLNNKKKQISDLEQANKTKAEQIQKLTDEINANTQHIAKITSEISESENKLKSTENDFIFTYEKVSKQITDNRDKIKTLN